MATLPFIALLVLEPILPLIYYPFLHKQREALSWVLFAFFLDMKVGYLGSLYYLLSTMCRFSITSKFLLRSFAELAMIVEEKPLRE